MTTESQDSLRAEVRRRITIIQQIARQAWRDKTDQDLPTPCRLVVKFDNNQGNNDIWTDEIRVLIGEEPVNGPYPYEKGGPRNRVINALHCLGDPDQNLRSLILDLSKLSEHDEPTLDDCIQGQLTINLSAGTVERFIHETLVERWDTDDVDVATLLGTNAPG